jgi:hypothetical protein
MRTGTDLKWNDFENENGFEKWTIMKMRATLKIERLWKWERIWKLNNFENKNGFENWTILRADNEFENWMILEMRTRNWEQL